MNLYVMRHGHTSYNELGLCNDDPNTYVSLDNTGIQQARAAAEQLRNINIDNCETRCYKLDTSYQ
jgi:probable phosphoglycerate mutase